MKTVIFSLALVATSFTNIIFNHVPLKCSINDTRLYQGCLLGQYCSEDGDCVAVDSEKELSSRSTSADLEPRQGIFSTDGTCGPAHENTICDPNSKAYTGRCCSQYGWCGNTAAHCETGCVSGCGAAPPPTVAGAPRGDGRCGSNFGGALCDSKGPFGGCCSQYGWCGTTQDHCLISNGCQNGCMDSSPCSDPIFPRDDGRCGSAFGGATCDPTGPYGGCCSQYGYCGSDSDHCLVAKGCQSGCTNSTPSNPSQSPQPTSPAAQQATSQEPVIAPVSSTMAPVETAGAPVTTDGTCGVSNGNTVCGDWPNGNCCSMYGFCGNTSAHCGAGCQSGNCISAPVAAAPGPSPAPAAPVQGSFKIVGQAGVAAMHAGLMPNGRVFFLDKLQNYSQLRTADGYYAMSAEYDPQTNTVVPLAYLTNAFCSGGTFLPDGRLISVGGNGPLTWLDPNIGDGFNGIRYLSRSPTDASLNGQSWSEPGNKLAGARWYATVQTLPNGNIFVASGSLNGLDPTVLSNNNPTYEILNPVGISQGNNIPMDILANNQPYYMYPFVHALKDGTLFVFVSKASQIFNPASNTIVKELPDLPGEYRTYPNTGGSVLLPLSSANNWNPDVVICGGGAYQDITSPTEASCGRIQPLSANPSWEMESMPGGRGMVEGTLLPDGTVVWLNGGSQGAQGFGLMRNPTLEALLYDPAKPRGQSFSTLAISTIPRLYHSVALLLLDGTLMVAGSDPVEMPVLVPSAQNPYVTEYRVEVYTPPYLQGDNANKRPTNVKLSTTTIAADGSTFHVSFTVRAGAQKFSVVLYHGGFVTHSVHMGHRMLQLDVAGWAPGSTSQNLAVTGPPNTNVAIPGPYVVYVVSDGIPSVGQFVTVH